ncbi:MAG: transcriptional regulator [Gammaproteobacteria bacterium]|nr:transcriptional regulator [Gammaproteobacteria bacterium]
MDIHPIKTELDYQNALKEIERLMDAQPDTPEGDRLDIMATLIAAYEEKHYPIENPDPIDAILHRMDVLGIDRKDLEKIIGTRARVSEILNRKRPLTINMIRRISGKLCISANVLIQPYQLHAESK